MINLSIISAEDKKQENKIYWLEKELKKEAERIKEEIERPAKIEKVLCTTWEIIKKEIETSHSNWVDITIICSEMFKLTNIENWYCYFNPVCEMVETLLTEAGYEYEYFHEYGPQWQSRSGKYGYFRIRIN